MPVTPFHFGPGLLLKGLAPSRVSLAAFVLANVVIDAESVVNLLAGRSPVHATFHTLAGATIAGAACGALVAWVGRRRGAASAEWRAGPALVGGVLGGLGQTGLDAIMHSDLRPFLPVSAANPLLGAVDLDLLHLACVVTGVVGLAVLGMRQWRRS
ncbi:hypothetical protein [Rubrivirga marina]|uniref:Uncharacterized protein n=1 Tax=Rubrivirga marina TaxID=1196024 RepID=A0A271J4N7_9BACT|nr:hypothetical protein [Rubrivirga marina]PAP77649.1 hypothetical protein BSZ37_14970 [Rubrivirga marina]